MIHLGASIISSIKAAADDMPIDDEQFKVGIIMGYEAACRVAIAMQPSHKNRGYHTAGTCGTIGCAVGVAFALGMDKAQVKRVLTSAAGSAAGMLEIQEQKSEIKPYNVGRAAMDEKIVSLAQKVKVIEDPSLTAESPKKRIAIVTVTMNDGTEQTARVDYAKGDPENPMTEEELAEKKRLLLAYSADYR